MIDATNIFTPQRAKNIMTEADTDQVYHLWQDYKDVIDKCAIVDLETVRAKDYMLSVNTYIEKTPAETISPEEVRRQFKAALEEVQEAEAELLRLLQEGGYIHG